jgi:predicted transposase YdaD
MIQEAYCKLQVMSEDEANRMIYEARLNARRDEYSRLQGARQEGLMEGRKAGRKEGLTEGRKAGLTEGRKAGLTEGRKEGRKEGLTEGRKEGLRETARNLKAMGVPIEPILQATGLTEAQVKEL